MPSIESIISNADIFKGNPVEYELLTGGYVNKTYKVLCDNHAYCVRINNNRQTPFFGLDGEKEAHACHQASLLSIAPRVYNIENTKEYLITDFFKGSCLTNDNVRDPKVMEKYVNAIKLIHDNVKVDRDFSIFDQLDKYIEAAKSSNLLLPDGLERVMAEVERIKETRSGSKLLYKVFCHNDIWHNNILYDGNTVCIIDWEYCGYGDGFFDFAYIANCAGLTFEEEKLMLTVYFGCFEMEMWEILRQMKYISDVYGTTWYVFHACLTDDMNLKNRYMEEATKGIAGIASRI